MLVPEGTVYYDEIGMADLKGLDGTVLFPSAVAPPEPEYTLLAYLTNPNPAPETESDGPASVALFIQDSDTYLFDGGSVRVTGADGLPDASTLMAELRVEVDSRRCCTEPVYTAGPVLTNPNPEPGDDPALSDALHL